MSDERPEPELQFRGTWNHAEIHQALSEGVISPTEFVLLAVVESYVKMKGEGCWASNRLLGKMTAKKVRQVIYMVRKLERLGFLIPGGTKKVGYETRRVLFTKWSQAPHAMHCMPPMQPTAPISSSLLRRDSVKTHRPRRQKPPRATGRNHTMMDKALGVDPDKKSPSDDAKRLSRKHKLWCAKTFKGLEVTSNRWWSEQFHQLIKARGVETVEKVLDWYHDNFGPDGFRMKLKSGARFRENFDRIEHAMEKDAKKKVEVSDLAKEVAESLSSHTWPKKSSTHLPAAVQISLDNFRSVVKRIKMARFSTDLKVKRVADTVFDLHLSPQSSEYVREHFRSLNSFLHRLGDQWNGDLFSFVMTEDKITEDFLGRLEKAGCKCSTITWDKIMKGKK